MRLKKCKVCGRECKKLTKGMCGKHYAQLLRHGETLKRTIYDPNEIIIHEDYAEIILYNKQCEEIARALIDLDDVDRVKNYKWGLHSCGYVEHGRHDNQILLHRLIMNPQDDMVVDHINHNPLDNRKSNLRICTQQKNVINKRKQSNNTSGTVGVTWNQSRKKWVAQIQINRKNITLGRFNTKEEAIQARKQAEIEYFGEYRNQEDED